MALPTDDEVVAYLDTLSNWGRWGPEDQLGTLNLITADKRARAAGMAVLGETISCASEPPARGCTTSTASGPSGWARRTASRAPRSTSDWCSTVSA